jgi:MraZ protein
VGMGFLGEHSPRLDEKGRMVLPAKFRDGFAGGLVLAKGQGRCITMWPADEWSEYADRVTKASQTDPKVLAYQRVLFSGAFDQIPDRQGRITVPQLLREYAALDREVIVTGKNTVAEIWDKSSWQEYLADQDDAFADLSGVVIPGL